MSSVFSNYQDLIQTISSREQRRDSNQILIMRKCSAHAISSCIMAFNMVVKLIVVGRMGYYPMKWLRSSIISL